MTEETLFVLALEQPPSDRDAFLDAASAGDLALRRQVADLLAAHERADGFFDPLAATPLGSANGATPFASRVLDSSEAPEVVAGRYRIVRPLGEGGMGVVYLAEQTAPVRRDVALKIVRPGMGTAAVVARFEAERQALAVMDHPHIAKVLDGGTTDDGRPFFVMELVHGIPVTQFCDERRLSVPDRLRLFARICQAVHHAHQKGIIHRDLKPSNVLIAEEDGVPVPKVIDFGVAKAVGEPRGAGGLTEYGMVIGTPEYMSPEQADLTAGDVDTRADIYALAVLLYELLTGTTPLDRERMRRTPILEALRVVREEDPPPPSRRLAVHPRPGEVAAARGTDPDRLAKAVRGELDWIALKGLDRARDRRYESASGLAADVCRHLADEPVSAGRPSVGYRVRKFVRRNRLTVANAAALLVVAVAAVGAVAASLGWSARDRAARRAAVETEVTRAVDEAEAEFARDRLPEAVAAVKRADALLAGGEVGDRLRDRVNRWRLDLETAARLEELRAEDTDPAEELFDRSGAERAYRRAFVEYGLDPVAPDPAAVAGSAIADRLVAALDDWAMVRLAAGRADAGQLFGVARLADPDPWRDRLRAAVLARDRKALEVLARDPVILDQSPATVYLLGRALYRVCGRPTSAAVLRLAQQRCPTDFWINQSLGLALSKISPREAVAYHRVAVALRPGSAGARINLGVALLRTGEPVAAEAEFRKALVIRPDSPKAHLNLGNSLRDSTGPGAALPHYREAVRLDPELTSARINLGRMLVLLKQPWEAEDHLRAGLAVWPRERSGRQALAGALFWQGRLIGAEAVVREIIALRPTEGEPYFWLAGCLTLQAQLPRALAAVAEGAHHTSNAVKLPQLPRIVTTLPWSSSAAKPRPAHDAGNRRGQ